MKHFHNHVVEQVPPDYYQKGVRENFLQRKWHMGKLQSVLSVIEGDPKKILDIGCASGWFLSNIGKKYPRAKCHGVDIYDKAIEFGEKKYPKITFKVSDAHKIPYRAGEFDLIICTEVMEHVEDPLTVLKEMRRLLSKNGQAVIELDSGSLLFSVVWYLWRLGQGNVWNHSHLHSFNIEKLEKLIRKSGLKVEFRRKFNYGMAMIFSVRKA